MLNEARFSRLDIREELQGFNLMVAEVRDKYSPDYNEKDIIWTVARLKSWGKTLDDLNIPEHLQTAALVKIATMALDDLIAKTKNVYRLAMLESLRPQLQVCLDFVDPEGRGFATFEMAEQVLLALYDEIDFQI